MKRLRFLEKAQWWDAERLHSYRDQALRSLLKVAYEEVPFYRDLMDKAGITPMDVRSRNDLDALPIVTKDMMRTAYPKRTTRNTGQKTFEVSTSGSTGQNFFVTEDLQTAGMYRAAFMLALEWSGWQLGEAHLQTGMTLKRSADRRLKDIILKCHYVSAFDLSDASLDAVLELLERHRIKYVWGYPGSLYCLAQRARRRGWNRPLRSVVTWGDSLYVHYRRTIEQAFSTRVFDTYGCGEGVQIAAQCGVANTYHVHTPDVIVECVDEDGRPVKEGQPGGVLLTRLHAGPMPLIRYRVGDVGVTRGGGCECGRGYECLDSIQGREADIIVTSSGNRLIVHFFTGILEHFREIETFQVVQQDAGTLLVRVVPVGDLSNDTINRITCALKEHGADMRIDVERVATIPLSAGGKRRFVIANMSAEPVAGPDGGSGAAQRVVGH